MRILLALTLTAAALPAANLATADLAAADLPAATPAIAARASTASPPVLAQPPANTSPPVKTGPASSTPPTAVRSCAVREQPGAMACMALRRTTSSLSSSARMAGAATVGPASHRRSSRRCTRWAASRARMITRRPTVCERVPFPRRDVRPQWQLRDTVLPSNCGLGRTDRPGYAERGGRPTPARRHGNQSLGRCVVTV
jgi:hypothetical protein